jgi:hypothetical protein
MSFHGETNIATIKTVFTEEILAAHGTVTDIFHDQNRLFARSILPWVADVRPRDKVQGGVALRAVDEDVFIHPYVFRQVCRNGAIMAHAIESRQLVFSFDLDTDEACSPLRDAIRECCCQDAFATATNQMRTASLREADVALNAMAIMSGLPSRLAARLINTVFKRFMEGSDRSGFGLMNAVTSLARDTRDPDVRWRLEELGGAVPVMRSPTQSPGTAARQFVRT